MPRRLFVMVVGFYLQGACGVRCRDLPTTGVWTFLVIGYLFLHTFCRQYAAVNLKRAPRKTFSGNRKRRVSQTLNPARDETLVVNVVVKDTLVFVTAGLLLFIRIC